MRLRKLLKQRSGVGISKAEGSSDRTKNPTSVSGGDEGRDAEVAAFLLEVIGSSNRTKNPTSVSGGDEGRDAELAAFLSEVMQQNDDPVVVAAIQRQMEATQAEKESRNDDTLESTFLAMMKAAGAYSAFKSVERSAIRLVASEDNENACACIFDDITKSPLFDDNDADDERSALSRTDRNATFDTEVERMKIGLEEAKRRQETEGREEAEGVEEVLVLDNLSNYGKVCHTTNTNRNNQTDPKAVEITEFHKLSKTQDDMDLEQRSSKRAAEILQANQTQTNCKFPSTSNQAETKDDAAKGEAKAKAAAVVSSLDDVAKAEAKEKATAVVSSVTREDDDSRVSVGSVMAGAAAALGLEAAVAAKKSEDASSEDASIPPPPPDGSSGNGDVTAMTGNSRARCSVDDWIGTKPTIVEVEEDVEPKLYEDKKTHENANRMGTVNAETSEEYKQIPIQLTKFIEVAAQSVDAIEKAVDTVFDTIAADTMIDTACIDQFYERINAPTLELPDDSSANDGQENMTMENNSGADNEPTKEVGLAIHVENKSDTPDGLTVALVRVRKVQSIDD